MRRRLKDAIRALLLAAALFFVAVPAAYAVEVRIVPASISANSGDVVSLTVQVDSAAELAGFQFDFSCPSASLHLTEVTIAPAFEHTVRNSFNAVAGSGLVAAYSSTPLTGANLVLATIEFTVTGGGTLPVTLSRQLLGSVSGDEILSTVSGGSISATSPLASQTIGPITLTPGTLAVNGTATAGAVASSGLGVIFTSTTPAVCTVSGTTVSGVTAGTCTIAANQSGNALYEPAPQVTQDITVDKATVVVTLGGLTPVYDGTAKGAIVTTNPAGKGVTVTYDGSAAAPTNAGSYAVVATISDSNYQGSASGTLVIAKAAATVTLSGLSHTFDGTPKTVTVITNPAGKTVTVTYNGTSQAPTAAGSYAVMATVSDSNYVGSASGTLVITNPPPDTIAPLVTAFTLPATATSLTVPVATLSATDAVGVSGYILRETGTQPPAGDPAWTATAPSQYTFASQGTRTLFAFARDAAGNISVPLSAQVTISMADTVAPVVTLLTLPATAASLTVPVTELTATDATGVTGYLLSESVAQPQGNDPNWSVTPPAQFVFFSQGAKNLYAFAKDAAGNISAPLLATVTITLADTTAPVITGFTLPATATSLAVPVSTLVATDTVGVAAYLLSESNVKPPADAPAWSADKPVAYTFLSQGVKILYAFAKDAAGNISAAASATVRISLADTTAPVVSSFTIMSAATGLTVSVTSFSATDAGGVTGYYLGETSTAPLQNDLQWSATPVSSYTFASSGEKTLYAFARDAAGNISAAVSASVTITLADKIAPTVTVFVIPATSASLTVPVTSFAATDNSAVTGFLITGAATAPSANVSGWSSTAPSSYACPTWGNNTLYAYTKDAAGNVSAFKTASVRIGPTSGVIIPAPSGSPAKEGPELADALKSLNFAMKVETPDAVQKQHADVAPLVHGVPQPDGDVNLGDTIVILRRVVGLW